MTLRQKTTNQLSKLVSHKFHVLSAFFVLGFFYIFFKIKSSLLLTIPNLQVFYAYIYTGLLMDKNF